MNVYLDNSATTKICPEALERYNRISCEVFGNPSSLHSLGFLAERELDFARAEILAALGEKRVTVIFTSSGTEANNLATLGRAFSKKRYLGRGKIITTDSEHASLNAPLDMLSGLGFEIVKIPTRGGNLDLDILKRELSPSVILVSLMLINNETGALYDLREAARLTRTLSPEALVHTDATQGFLKLPFTMRSLGVDMITVSSHKIHGPKGVGALVVLEEIIKKKGLAAITLGGGQEGNLRSGTENVPAISAFGEAVRIGLANVNNTYERTNALRERLISLIEKSEKLKERVTLLLPERHAPHILNISLPGIKSETLLHYLSSVGIFVSSGSACSSNSGHKSGALIAYGISESEADSAIRISFSKDNKEEDCEALVQALEAACDRLGGLSRR